MKQLRRRLSDATRDGERCQTIKTAQIRQSFLDYFERHDHRIVPSSPVIPFDDPTLLFTNAGMNQFKEVFTGLREVEYKRAASVQKCIRAGGKHNDLDNVGFTSRHHTFFEMLGNFSFGDYFKEEAIVFAWEWVTKELALPVGRLYATVYEEDDQAFKLWEKIARPLKGGRVLRFGKKDNYWAMGDTGPCGPCSEMHYDRGETFGTGPGDVVNGETERFAEIWNLVFMQFERRPDGTIVPLPKPSVDTGAGLERLAAIIQNADSNYGIDIFKGLIEAISEITKSRYEDAVSSHHVIADHVRALTFAIADGAGISNEGQGYVLRRIVRRAARHGRLLNYHEPFIYRLVPVVVEQMSDVYPEVKEKQALIENVIRAEEEAFSRTLETGCELFEKMARSAQASDQKIIPGKDVFRLYDTYGFPYDLTEIMASEYGLALDQVGFRAAMERQKEQSRAGARFEAESEMVAGILDRHTEGIPATEFVRGSLSLTAEILGVCPLDEDGERIAVILNRTPFYAEAGGQIDDTGKICSERAEAAVTSMYNHRDRYVHLARLLTGTLTDLKPGTEVTAIVNVDRRWDIMRNHTATHLTHAALRRVLGLHIKQSGSYVGPDRLRFDFSHHQPLTPNEIRQVEQTVNEQILTGAAVCTEETDMETARQSGAMALFGEKYADTVRVVSVTDFSRELCGGTHVTNVSQIGPFFITLETGVASGVRRLEAITGREAIKYMLEAKRFRQDVAAAIGRPETEALAGVQQLRDNAASLHKELKRLKVEMFAGGSKQVGDETSLGKLRIISHDFGETDRDVMAGWIDMQKARNDAVVAFAFGTANGKPTFMASGSFGAIEDYGMHVGQIVKESLPQFGGRGGGKPSFAQGTVPQETSPQELFQTVRRIVKARAGKRDS